MTNIKHITILLLCLLATSLAFQPQSSLVIRGGSDYDYESEYDSDVETPTKLSSSAKKALEKANKKRAKKSSKTVSKAMASGIRIPYLLKVILNPFTIMSMTKGYFASLFNIDYLQEVRILFYISIHLASIFAHVFFLGCKPNSSIGIARKGQVDWGN